MPQAPNIDGVLMQWGDRLFYPGNRIMRVRPQPKLRGQAAQQRAATIRQRIEATVVRRAPQVMVKVTGGGRGMMAIAAHFHYISKNGRLDIEEERGETRAAPTRSRASSPSRGGQDLNADCNLAARWGRLRVRLPNGVGAFNRDVRALLSG